MSEHTFRKIIRSVLLTANNTFMLYLITTPSCPDCPKAKELLSEKAINYERINGATQEGLTFAREYAVMHVPTLLEINQDHRLQRKLSGLSEILQAF